MTQPELGDINWARLSNQKLTVDVQQMDEIELHYKNRKYRIEERKNGIQLVQTDGGGSPE